jgi:hypothetical protein
MTSPYPSAAPAGTMSDPGRVAPDSGPVAADNRVAAPRRLTTETRRSYKTSELFVYLAAVFGVLLASWAVGTGDGHDDYFRADRAWFLVVLLTIGYLVSRGLSKVGSRERYDGQ